MSRASNLYRLQELELELERLADRKGQIDVLLASSQEVSRAAQRLDETQQELVRSRSAMGAIDQEVAAQEGKLAKSEKALYGGSVTDPKQLEELQMESTSLRKYLSTLEDRQLERMIELDESESEYESAKANLELVQAQMAAEHKGLSEERGKILIDMDRIETEQEAAVASIHNADLNDYRAIQAKVGIRALATVKDRSCSACGMAIPASQLQAVRSTSDLARCEQCGRILYEQ